MEFATSVISKQDILFQFIIEVLINKGIAPLEAGKTVAAEARLALYHINIERFHNWRLSANTASDR
ncbi:MAG: hypothetical protein O7A08_10835 [SAR324 cluster bacterium]|nr:hypothetical protein [SAR324 cluster bacterium]MCZ6533444.1 hypothetical protein [SAR324 cluster bacterium]MCZ6557116.1 hypothetical protein [SAR324 cluster bacterium]MCZ6627493.1 hypothetical protein [SAR324 cluster bacterium]MCZ6841652.1 hypothetical protein [SAR324 cluster bacterium]